MYNHYQINFQKDSTFARPYAKAILNFSLKRNSFDTWRRMLSLICKIIQHPKFNRLLCSQKPQKELAKILIMLCKDFIDNYARNLICIIAENNRLKLFPEILRQLIKLRNSENNIIVAEVFSSINLDEYQKSLILKSIKNKFFKKNIQLTFIIDKTIILGFLIRIEDFVIDLSFCNYIERLNFFLKS